MTDPVTAPAAPAPTAPLSAASALMPTAAAPEAPAAPAGDAPAGTTPPVDAKPADGQPAPLALPGKDATPEQWAEFYGQIGRPATPDEYQMEIPEGDDGTFAKQVSPLLHKVGITGEQAKALSQGWNQMRADAEAEIANQEQQRITAMDVKNRAEAAALQTEWGTAHEANMHFAKQAVQQFMPPDKAPAVIAALESSLGYKETIKFLHGIGQGLGEHDAAGMGNKTGTPQKTLAERLYGPK